MKKRKVKYLYIELEERNGEREYTHRCLHVTKCENIDFAAELYCAHFWGTASRREDNWWWFYDFAVRVSSVRILTKRQYTMLNKFMY